MISRADIYDIVSEANRAPSVHNTQPTRWEFNGDTIKLYAHLESCLAVGDPELRDAGLSCGAALEGTLMALEARGYEAVAVTDHWPSPEGKTQNGYRLASDIKITANTNIAPSPLRELTEKRFTWRGKFKVPDANIVQALKSWGVDIPNDVIVVEAPESLRWLGKINDIASLGFFKNRAYREELLSYMRLSPSHPLYELDGLNRDAMQLSGFEAKAAGAVLKFPVFETLASIGLGKTLVSELEKTLSATAIVLFLAAPDASPTEIGRRFYRLWLELTEMGLVGWPMAVIADDLEVNAQVCDRFGIKDLNLINAWRVGCAPQGTIIPPARRSPEQLLFPEQLLSKES